MEILGLIAKGVMAVFSGVVLLAVVAAANSILLKKD